MKTFHVFGKVAVFLILTGAFILFPASLVNAQNNTKSDGFRLTLDEAVEFSRSQNKMVQAAAAAQSATGEDRKDAYKAALPFVNASASYQRFSDLTLFEDGLSHSTTGPRKPTPNAGTLGIDALFNIYSGGKQRALQSEHDAHLKLAELNTTDQAGSIAMQTAVKYLDMVLLNDLHNFILDQLKRAQTRLKNINSLYRNQKITRSDVLRAEVMLSNVELALQQNENDMLIANQQLNIFMNIPDSVRILPADSAGMHKPELTTILDLTKGARLNSYEVQKANQRIDIQRAKIRGVQSSSLPSINFYTAYGLNYPNYLFYPPVDQAYSIGFVGLRAQYSISSIYHNKSKVSASKLREKELEWQQQAVADKVRAEANAYYIKYKEALTRISVNERSVEQAKVNYRIVSTKYFNQLTLLTDLLDADNLLQESRINLIKAQTDAIAIYYRILYTSGNL